MRRLLLGLIACAVLGAAAGLSPHPARAQCYPGLACPPAPAPAPAPQAPLPQAVAPAPRPATPSGAAAETYRVQDNVSDGVLNMRAEPSVEAKLIVAIPASSRGLRISRCAPPRDGASRHHWCSAKWQGYEGWVSSCCILGEQSGRKP